MDGDGWVTEEDMKLVEQYLVGNRTLSEAERGRADVSGEGVIHIKDVLFIGQFIACTRDNFPVCGI